MRIDLSGMRITVMGLGVHGGGLSAVRYASQGGADVTVTDLRTEGALQSSLDGLPRGCRVVLGRHEEHDFRTADIVIKNPAVPRTAPFLSMAPAVTNDIALFFAEWIPEGVTPPLIAVTGTKGKSTCSSAAAHILATARPGSRLGGNITISPLEFVADLTPDTPVVLELSSFQLGDLAFFRNHNSRPESRIPPNLPRAVFFPVVPAAAAIITNIFEDHQDYYGSMESYVADKTEIYRNLRHESAVILSEQCPWTPYFIEDMHSHSIGAVQHVIPTPPKDIPGMPERLPLGGAHNHLNIAMAAQSALHLGLTPQEVRRGIETFTGIAHRLQTITRRGGIRYVNDTAATIPEAAQAAVTAFAEDETSGPVFLIAGGSDKGLAPGPLIEAFRRCQATGGTVALLAGSATDRMYTALAGTDLPRFPQFDNLPDAVAYLETTAENCGGTGEKVILLSPGCASFGMFQNEFDRGNRFIEIVTGADGS